MIESAKDSGYYPRISDCGKLEKLLRVHGIRYMEKL